MSKSFFKNMLIITLCAGFLFSVAYAQINFGPPTGQPSGGGPFGYPTGHTQHYGKFGPPAGVHKHVPVKGSTGYYTTTNSGGLINHTTGEVLSPIYSHGQVVGYNGNKGTKFVKKSDGSFGSSSGLSIHNNNSNSASTVGSGTYSVVQSKDCVYTRFEQVQLKDGYDVVGYLAVNEVFRVNKRQDSWVWLVDYSGRSLGGWVHERFLSPVQC
jgi:hypothetical protein